MLVVVGAAATAAYFGGARQFVSFLTPAPAQRAPAPAIPVRAAVVKRQDVPVFLTGLGTVQAFNSVLVKSRVDGQIIKINFIEGQNVRAGDVLVEIDPAPYQAALAQAQANKLKDQAQLENARLDLERFSRLGTTNAVSKQQLDTARAVVGQLEATIKADQAMIDMAQTQVDYTRIKSLIDGRVGAKLVDIGNIVRAADTTGIVTVNQLNPINVTFALPANSLPRIKASAGNRDVRVVAQDSNGNDLLSGKLTVIDNLINPATSTINYKATFDNPAEVLWPGQFVNIRVELEYAAQCHCRAGDRGPARAGRSLRVRGGSKSHGIEACHQGEHDEQVRGCRRQRLGAWRRRGDRGTISDSRRQHRGSPPRSRPAAWLKPHGIADELFRPICRQADRDNAADDRHHAIGCGRLRIAANCRGSAGGYPDDPCVCQAAGRQCGDDGNLGGDAVGTAVGADLRRHLDQFNEFARKYCHSG